MAEEKENGVETEEMEDIEIAELANTALRKKDEEIRKLKKDLAKAKLYSEAPDENEEKSLDRDECIRRISDSKTNNYDYAEAVVGLVESEKKLGNPNPLGKDGDAVCEFFKGVIEECDGDKSRFTDIYQSRLAPDDKSISMAYSKRK